MATFPHVALPVIIAVGKTQLYTRLAQNLHTLTTLIPTGNFTTLTDVIRKVVHTIHTPYYYYPLSKKITINNRRVCGALV